jgi:hypothetical protein
VTGRKLATIHGGAAAIATSDASEEAHDDRLLARRKADRLMGERKKATDPVELSPPAETAFRPRWEESERCPAE